MNNIIPFPNSAPFGAVYHKASLRNFDALCSEPSFNPCAIGKFADIIGKPISFDLFVIRGGKAEQVQS